MVEESDFEDVFSQAANGNTANGVGDDGFERLLKCFCGNQKLTEYWHEDGLRRKRESDELILSSKNAIM